MEQNSSEKVSENQKKEAEAEQAGVEESVDVQKVVDAAHGELDK